MSSSVLLSLRDLRIAFHGGPPVVKGVSCNVWEGSTTCIVGESGSGKTLTSLAVMGLLPPGGEVVGGEIHGPGGTFWAGPGRQEAPVGKEVAMIFQDPMSSLNPSMRVGAQVAEPLELHQGLSGKAVEEKVEEHLTLGCPLRRRGVFCIRIIYGEPPVNHMNHHEPQ